jgi:hypothetical protein
MSMAYIRKTYGVPAKRGGKVRYTYHNGIVLTGTIISTHAALLRVRSDNPKHRPILLHPEQLGLEYLDV